MPSPSTAGRGRGMVLAVTVGILAGGAAYVSPVGEVVGQLAPLPDTPAQPETIATFPSDVPVLPVGVASDARDIFAQERASLGLPADARVIESVLWHDGPTLLGAALRVEFPSPVSGRRVWPDIAFPSETEAAASRARGERAVPVRELDSVRVTWALRDLRDAWVFVDTSRRHVARVIAGPRSPVQTWVDFSAEARS